MSVSVWAFWVGLVLLGVYVGLEYGLSTGVLFTAVLLAVVGFVVTKLEL